MMLASPSLAKIRARIGSSLVSILGHSVAFALTASCAASGSRVPLQFRVVSPHGFPQRVEVAPSDLEIVHISGQVALNESGAAVGEKSLQVQTEQVCRNIQTQLQRAGASMHDLIRIDCYSKDISKIAEFRRDRDKFINLENPPVSTAVQVSGFVRPELLIENNAVAAIRQK